MVAPLTVARFVFSTWSYAYHGKVRITSLSYSYNFLTHSPLTGQMCWIILVLSPGMLRLYAANTDYVKAPTTDEGVFAGQLQAKCQNQPARSHGALSKGIFTVPEASLTALTPGSLPLN